MTEQNESVDETTEEPVDDGDVHDSDSPAIPQMRKRIKELEADQKETSKLRQENALLKLGVDAGDKQVQLFLKAEGSEVDWSDVDSVKERLAEYDLYAPQSQGGEELSSDQRAEAQAHRAMSRASSQGSTQPVGGAPDYSQASSPEEVLEIARKHGATVQGGYSQ